MALLNRCMFRAASGGSGDFVVASAETGARTPTEAGATNGETYSYVAESDDRSQVAFGTGTWNGGTSTLVRGTEEFIGGGFAGNFSAAPRVMLTPLAVDFQGGGGGGAVEVIAHFDFGANPASAATVAIDFSKYSRVEMVSSGVRIDTSGMADGDLALGYACTIKDVSDNELLAESPVRNDNNAMHAVEAEAWEDGGVVASELVKHITTGIHIANGRASFLAPASATVENFEGGIFQNIIVTNASADVYGGVAYEMTADEQDVSLRFRCLNNDTDALTMNAGTLTFYGYKTT